MQIMPQPASGSATRWRQSTRGQIRQDGPIGSGAGWIDLGGPGQPTAIALAQYQGVFQAGAGMVAVCEGWRRGGEVDQMMDPAALGAKVREMAASVRKNSGMDGLELD